MKMKSLAVTQRAVTERSHNIRVDTLDQRWPIFIANCGFAVVPVSNVPNNVETLMTATQPSGILLTGGGDVASLGGQDYDRMEVENILFDWAQKTKTPVLGVCRGMQFLQERFKIALQPISDHVATNHEIEFANSSRKVNSYHAYGSYNTTKEIEILATSEDGVVEAIRHITKPIFGIMWHPERTDPFSTSDIELFRQVFGTKEAS